MLKNWQRSRGKPTSAPVIASVDVTENVQPQPYLPQIIYPDNWDHQAAAVVKPIATQEALPAPTIAADYLPGFDLRSPSFS